MRWHRHKWSAWVPYAFTDEERRRIFGDDDRSPTRDPASRVRTCLKCGKTERWGL